MKLKFVIIRNQILNLRFTSPVQYTYSYPIQVYTYEMVHVVMGRYANGMELCIGAMKQLWYLKYSNFDFNIFQALGSSTSTIVSLNVLYCMGCTSKYRSVVIYIVYFTMAWSMTWTNMEVLVNFWFFYSCLCMADMTWKLRGQSAGGGLFQLYKHVQCT